MRDKRKVMFIPFASSYVCIEIDSVHALLSALSDRHRLGSGTTFEGPLAIAHTSHLCL